MIIGTTLVILILCNLLVSSLIANVAVNINKTYDNDHKAYDYALASSSLGFVSLGLLIGFLLFHKLYVNIKNAYLYSLAAMCIVLIILSTLIYLSYDKLVKSKNYPPSSNNKLNKTEINLAFAAFCISIVCLSVCLSVGLTYVITKGTHEGYFGNMSGNVFGIKSFFEDLFGESSEKSKVSEETIEMDDLISELIDTRF